MHFADSLRERSSAWAREGARALRALRQAFEGVWTPDVVRALCAATGIEAVLHVSDIVTCLSAAGAQLLELCGLDMLLTIVENPSGMQLLGMKDVMFVKEYVGIEPTGKNQRACME